MSNYTKSTNFTSKDSLASGNPLKIVKGSEFDTEFNNIATAVATKADLASPSLTGVPEAPTATSGTNTTQIATTAFVFAERAATTTLTNKTLTSPSLSDATLTGVPVAPTAAVNTNTTQVATTAFVVAQIADDAPTKTGTGASGTWGIDISGNAATATNASTVTTITSSQVTNATASASLGAVGTYALLRDISGTSYSPGDTAASTYLRYTSADGVNSGTGPSGTWRLMGFSGGGGSGNSVSLWLRIS